MGKQVVKLTESQLHQIIKESVKTILSEVGETEKGQEALGALASRKYLQSDGTKKGKDGKLKFPKEFEKVHKYAKNKRGDDEDFENGKEDKEMHKKRDAYATGYLKYLNSHPEEQVEFNKRLKKKE